MSLSKTGIKSHKFSGYYITPWGKFESSRIAETEIVTNVSISTWCKNPNKIISKSSISHSKYLKPEHLGKTFKELGFEPTA